MIRLFDIQNKKVVPTSHCYTIGGLKDVIDTYGEEEALKVFSYIFYMTCPNPAENPFFDVPEIDKEDVVLQEISPFNFGLEDSAVLYAKDLCERLFETPSVRAYKGIKGMLDKVAKYMEVTELTDGRDGNLTAITNVAKNFDQIRLSYKGILKDLIEEQTRARGDQNLGYDQS